MAKTVTTECPCCRTCPEPPECASGTVPIVVGTDSNGCDEYRCCDEPPTCSGGQTLVETGEDQFGCPTYRCCDGPPTCSGGRTPVEVGTDSDGCKIYECRLVNTECCNSAGGCTGYCPGPGCTPSDGVCCDGVCITCQDCGVGGEECCNSIEIQSLFEDLSNESEMIKWDSIVAELKSSWGEDKMDVLIDVLLRFGIQKDGFWKVSVFARAYVIDCLDDVANGVDIDIAYMKHHSEWAKFVTLVRSQA